MHQVPHPRELSLANNFKAGPFEHNSPIEFTSESARSGTFAPLPIMGPADEAVPGRLRNVFVNHCQAVRAQHALHFA